MHRFKQIDEFEIQGRGIFKLVSPLGDYTYGMRRESLGKEVQIGDKVFKVLGCAHHRKNIDNISRGVMCQDCEAWLDPFEVLSGVVRDRERTRAEQELYEVEIRDMEILLKVKRKELNSLDGKIARRKNNLTETKKNGY